MMRTVVLACMLGLFDADAMQADRDRAIRLATDTLASVLKIAPEKIQLVSAESVDWPNSSLGCPKPGMSYMQVIVPGFRVKLAVGDRQHEVHIGKGQAIICDDTSTSAPPSRSPAVKPGLAAADRAKEHLALTLKAKPEEVTIERVHTWRSTEPRCDPPDGITVKGETFFVELKRGATTYTYRATPDVAWTCK